MEYASSGLRPFHVKHKKTRVPQRNASVIIDVRNILYIIKRRFFVLGKSPRLLDEQTSNGEPDTRRDSAFTVKLEQIQRKHDEAMLDQIISAEANNNLAT
jgi:hypothetical protein